MLGKEKDLKKLREFNNDENALVTNYGVCTKCYKNISMLARKCPYCTADLG